MIMIITCTDLKYSVVHQQIGTELKYLVVHKTKTTQGWEEQHSSKSGKYKK